jgi:hypothetical protein
VEPPPLPSIATRSHMTDLWPSMSTVAPDRRDINGRTRLSESVALIHLLWKASAENYREPTQANKAKRTIEALFVVTELHLSAVFVP